MNLAFSTRDKIEENPYGQSGRVISYSSFGGGWFKLADNPEKHVFILCSAISNPKRTDEPHEEKPEHVLCLASFCTTQDCSYNMDKSTQHNPETAQLTQNTKIYMCKYFLLLIHATGRSK
jgi:hypothetical protein